MLKLEFDVCQPRFGASRVSEDVLLVDCIFFGLRTVSDYVSSGDNALLTIRYKSALARDSFDFEALGAAMIGRSSPGILCLL